MKLANKFLMGVVMGGSLLMTTSCEDFLDREPISSITPELYFNSASDLAAYVTKYYDDELVNVDGTPLYHKVATWDGGTGTYSDYWSDNLAIGTGTSVTSRFGDGSGWTVSANQTLKSTYVSIRKMCWFLDQVVPKMENGTLADDASKNYIGEAYFMRANAYFVGLAQYGDLPIVKEALTDDAEMLAEASVRSPRHEVAKFILEDLDKAISLLQPRSAFGGQRINKETALLLKSRVALFEGTFEKYHQGTERVSDASNVNYFLEQAMAAAKQIADATQLTENTGVLEPTEAAVMGGNYYGWNPYFEMFSQPSLKDVPEALMWREYSYALGKTNNVPIRSCVGNNTGYTRSLVHSFLCTDGLPYYASPLYKGDKSLDNEFADRDLRLQLFTWTDSYGVTNAGVYSLKGLPNFLYGDAEKRVVTGYAPRKGYTYDFDQTQDDARWGRNACCMFRAAEAYLNYMEACYEKNGSLDGTAQNYWRALRKRAGVDQDFNKTIAATDLSKETEDWGLWSGANKVDATLFNIRRERRNEFIGENIRFMDMLRWRSFDQLNTREVNIYGFNFWEEYYDKFAAEKDDKGNAKYEIVADGSNGATVSPKELSNYAMPYRKTDNNNQLAKGLKWHDAYYLYPIGHEDFVVSPKLTQNPGWTTEGGSMATK